MGKIVRSKAISELAKAFSSLYQEKDWLRLVLVGTFAEKLDLLDEDVLQLVKTHPGIILAGWHDEVEYFMSIDITI